MTIAFGGRAALLAGALLVASAPAHAIIGGSDASNPDGTRSYTVGIMTRAGEICSGVVIAQDQVLTAAHCLARAPAEYIVALDTNFRPRQFKAGRSWRNPRFRIGVRPLRQRGADVGIITLTQPLPADMRPITIAADPSAIAAARSFTIAGFGVSEPGNRDSAGRLRETSLTPIGLARTGTISLFASASGDFGRSERSACLGDSGGPVVVEAMWSAPVLVGVISWVGGQEAGETCAGVTVATPTLLSDGEARSQLANAARRGQPTSAPPGRATALPPPPARIRIPGPDPAGSGAQ